MIELRNVTKVYPRRGEDPVVALDDLTLTIPEHAIHGIVGESGAGKSTLIRCLTALERPTSGSILVDGTDLATLPESKLRQARRRIGMVFQGANLLDSRTAAQNVAYPLKVARIPKEQRAARVAELFELVGLHGRENSYPSQLSGGQRQRVGIARAIADAPAVLLADEPTSALDMETTDQILQLLRDVRDRTGVTVLVITHEMDVVRKICDSVTLLDHGAIVESGSMQHIAQNPDSQLSLKLLPLPEIDATTLRGESLIDIFFTAHPGEPAGSKVLSLASQLGADIAAGYFESIGSVQVSRLALTVPTQSVPHVLEAFAHADIYAKVRAL
ncbi:MAG: methionine ABC transporter ATP-binding protein [Actinomycetaceae bacterium]|nr:methionine ABC transporter ATP-binding protein [Arcanobacterium sp.]MDD7686765.1 methionine ABC transporter ATP-binding protein [Actinomycetaceae bacterium]MDY5273880.1 methionine ABC transporter ATP-binding protein [Arcanobacterium sp.]